MTADRPHPPGSRPVSWLIGCVLVGWFIAYNAMRIGGDSPAEAAWPGLAVGAAAGIVVFALGLFAVRRLAASGRVVRSGHRAIPSPAEMDESQRDALRLAWPPLAALSVVALAMGVYLLADWLGADSADRPKTTIILAAWNVLAGLWLGDEALRLRRGEPDGIESIVLGCTLTAVLAGVGYSRDLFRPGQAALIVLTGIAGALVAVAVWRLQGARGFPLSAVGVVIVAALSLILPIVL